MKFELTYQIRVTDMTDGQNWYEILLKKNGFYPS